MGWGGGILGGGGVTYKQQEGFAVEEGEGRKMHETRTVGKRQCNKRRRRHPWDLYLDPSKKALRPVGHRSFSGDLTLEILNSILH